MGEDGYVKIKSHLIITDIHSEFNINWCGKFADCYPALDEGLPKFAIVGSRGRIEMATINMKQLEDCAKRLTEPRGRSAVTKDSARIYIKEIGGKETLMCVVTHKKVRSYAPMYDRIGWR